MKCVKCGGKFEIYDSRNAPLNTIRRARKCMSCKERVTTYEYIGVIPEGYETMSKRKPQMERKLMNDTPVMGLSSGATCPPPSGLLEQIELQIKIHESKAKKLTILKMKLAIDPELEDVIKETLNMLKGY